MTQNKILKNLYLINLPQHFEFHHLVRTLKSLKDSCIFLKNFWTLKKFWSTPSTFKNIIIQLLLITQEHYIYIFVYIRIWDKIDKIIQSRKSSKSSNSRVVCVISSCTTCNRLVTSKKNAIQILNYHRYVSIVWS